MIFLWNNRELPILLSRRWFVVWLKRIIHLPRLINILATRQFLIFNGLRIGKLSIIPMDSVIGPKKNLCVGTNTFISKGVNLSLHGRIQIGSYVAINQGACLLTASHRLNDPHWTQFSKDIFIGDHVWIATNAIILPGVTIGDGAVIGAGAVISKDVPAYAVAVGNPAENRLNKQCKNLVYDPTAFVAAYEAWLGKP